MSHASRDPSRQGPRSLPISLAAAWIAIFPAAVRSQVTPADTLDRPPASDSVFSARGIIVRVTRTEADLLRLPYAVSFLGPTERCEAERGASLEESLRAVPGLFIQNRRNFSLGDRIAIRGVGSRAQFGVRGVKILLDGIPLTLPDGQSVLTNLDLPSIGRTEVIRGPASALYGNAAGGVISLTTRAPPDAPFAGDTRFLGGSHGTLEARTRGAGRLGAAAYAASFSRFETEGYREHSRAEEYRGNVLARTSLSRSTRLSGILSLFHTPFARNPSSLSAEDARTRPRHARPFVVAQGAGESATQAQGGLALEADLAGGPRLRASGWGLGRDLRNPIPGRIIQIDRLAGGTRTEIQGETHLARRPLRWTGGFDLETQRDRRREWENLGLPPGEGRARAGSSLLDQRETVLGLGSFLELEAGLTPRLTLSAAGRMDRYHFRALDFRLEDGDDTGDRVLSRASPMVGLSYAVRPGLAVYGNFSTAFQTPTTSELSNRPDGEGGFNPSLGPERLKSFEVGARGVLAGPRLRFDLALYRAAVNGALIPFQGVSEEIFFRNAGQVDRSGVEATAGWQPSPALEVRMAYTLQRFRFDDFATADDDFSGNREPGVPDQQLFLSLVHRVPGGLRSEINLRWIDAFPVDDANTATNGSARIVDLRFSLDRRPGGLPARPFLGVDNLFAERYNASVVPNAFGNRFYEPAPGIEVYGGVSLEVGARRQRAAGDAG